MRILPKIIYWQLPKNDLSFLTLLLNSQPAHLKMIKCAFLISLTSSAFRAFILLIECQEEHPACKNNKASIRNRTVHHQFQATGQPVSRTQSSDAMTSRLPHYEVNCVQRRCFQWGSVPLTVSCFIQIQIGFTFLALTYPGCPVKRGC